MNKAHLIITAINVQGISYRQAAHQFGVSKSWVHKIHRRWLEEGDAAFLPRGLDPLLRTLAVSGFIMQQP
jgi:transposase